MVPCWECGQVAYQSFTWRYPNGKSLMRSYCKIHNPNNRLPRREYHEVIEENYESDPDELQKFMEEKMADFLENGHGSISD